MENVGRGDYLYNDCEEEKMWIVFGLGAMVTALLNIVRYAQSKNSEVFRFLSLSLTALTMCDFYNQNYIWVVAGDWVALMDVVPSTNAALWVLVAASIFVNGITLFKYKKLF